MAFPMMILGHSDAFVNKKGNPTMILNVCRKGNGSMQGIQPITLYVPAELQQGVLEQAKKLKQGQEVDVDYEPLNRGQGRFISWRPGSSS